jgi:beta-glucosidase
LLILVLLAGIAPVSFATDKDENYPREPDALRTGKVMWVEVLTPDGWAIVTNEDRVTLGYSNNSGLKLIQVDGYAFKDLNRNNLLG